MFDSTDLAAKLTILGDAAKYDASCSTSMGKKTDGAHCTHRAGICHSWTADGRCMSLLKVLYTNDCVYDCAYCPSRRSNDVRRAGFTPDELCELTMGFYRRNYVEGLFLSSGVSGSPDRTMEQIAVSLEQLRRQHGFRGYIHAKIIPGCSPELVARVGAVADRVSVNIELPSAPSLKLLAPQKRPAAIAAPMREIALRGKENESDRKKFAKAPMFAPAGQSTQMIIGATPDNDLSILSLSDRLYKRYEMRRVYFSAYMPAVRHELLPDRAAPLLREHRLYQADWLMRFYSFAVDEIVDDDNPALDMELDPKCAWALRHRALFPVEVNRADYELLLRVPGIGVTGARRIVAARRLAPLRYDELYKLGIVMKRAQYFITAGGAYRGRAPIDSPYLRAALCDTPNHAGQVTFGELLAPAALAAGLPALPEVAM